MYIQHKNISMALNSSQSIQGPMQFLELKTFLMVHVSTCTCIYNRICIRIHAYIDIYDRNH